MTHAAGGWTARIGGYEIPFTPAGDSVRFGSAQDSGGGEFRGAFTTGRATIAGFWIQPQSVWFSPQYFTAPLELRRDGKERWRGTVTPLEDRLTLYLSIVRKDSALLAVFRHPQANAFGGGLTYNVSTNGDSVYFVAPANQRRGEVRIVGAYDRSARTITIKWPPSVLDRPTVLRPQPRETAVQFYARLPRGAKYVYRPPPKLTDGWDVGRLKDVGFDEAAIARIVQRLVDTNYDAPRPPVFQSLLVGAMLAGEPIAPESLLVPTSDDPRKAKITLAHVLTHTTGLACDDNDDNSPGNEGVMQSQTKQPDWWRYTLDLPMVYEPGTHYAYCSGGMNLAAYMLTKSTHTWLPALFERTVAKPLDFGRWYWNLMPTEEGYSGGGMRILPRDLLKVGAAYLDGGVWHGRRIVSAEWAERSTVNQVAEGVGRDGYAWHLAGITVGDHKYREFEGNGNGGQFLIVVPEVDLAVVFTAGNYMDYGVWGQYRNVLVAEMIEAIPRAQR